MIYIYRLHLQDIVVRLREIKGFVVFTLPYKDVFHSILSIHCVASRIKILNYDYSIWLSNRTFRILLLTICNYVLRNLFS